MTNEKRQSPGWSPVTHFAIMSVFCTAMLGYFVYELVRDGFSWMPLALMLLGLFGAVMNIADLKRFRLTPAGLAIQHLLTRRTRVIAYAAIEEIIETREFKGRGTPGFEILRIRHGGRMDELKFFIDEGRDTFLRRLEACRQGEIDGNVDHASGQAALPAARVVSESRDWVYPWRRVG